jgi:hypothetical protein
LNTLIAKSNIQHLMWSSTRRVVSHSMPSFLVPKTMKELIPMLDFKTKMITIDEIILPMKNINHLQGTSMLCALKLNNSLAMEPKITQDATRCATQILDANYNKTDLQSIVKDNSKNLSANQQKKLLQLLKKI